MSYTKPQDHGAIRPDDKTLLSVREAAYLLGVEPDVARGLISRKELPATRVGLRAWVLARADVEALRQRWLDHPGQAPTLPIPADPAPPPRDPHGCGCDATARLHKLIDAQEDRHTTGAELIRIDGRLTGAGRGVEDNPAERAPHRSDDRRDRAPSCPVG